MRHSALAALFAAVAFGWAASGFAQTGETTITYPNARGTADRFATMDTRIGQQITSVHAYGDMGVPENPLLRKRNRAQLRGIKGRLDTESELIAGGIGTDPRAIFDSFFPGIQQDGWSPPDPTIAVGPEYIAMTVNMKIAWFRKSDGVKVFERWLGNQETLGFFRNVGAKGFTFDPKILYDRISQRFIVIVPEYYSSPREAALCVGVSDDSDPNGTWYLYRANFMQTVNGVQYWVDYPGFGIDHQAIYVNGNMFGFSGGFGGVVYRVIPKAPILSGGTMSYTDIVDTNSGSVQSGNHIGTPQAGYFIEDWTTSSMRIHAITNPTTNPVLYGTNVSVPAFSYPNSDAPQLGSGSLIDTLDGRIMYANWQNGRFVATHAVRSNSGNRTIGRWYEFNTGNWPTSGGVTLIQSGNVDPGNNAYALFPCVGLNDFNDIGMIVGRSASTQYAGVYVTGRKFTDSLGSMGPVQEVKVGSSPWTGGRWGDYFGIQTDPNDGLTFWGVGEYAEGGTWRTWVTSWRVAQYANLNVRAIQGGVGNINVGITCTTDGRGNGNGTTPFVRTYYSGTNVTLTAPASYNGKPFTAWILGPGVPGPTTPTININLTSDRTVTAFYAP